MCDTCNPAATDTFGQRLAENLPVDSVDEFVTGIEEMLLALNDPSDDLTASDPAPS